MVKPNVFPAGYYCGTKGLGNSTGPCKTGYFCSEGSIIEDPEECPIGFHCPQGSATPKPCIAGYFTNVSKAGSCQPCPKSYYCLPLELGKNQSKAYYICPRGFYCPGSVGMDWKPCPAGTYSDRLGLYEEKQCQDCDPGMYCDGRNLTAPTNSCAPGYYCTAGK